MDQLDTQLYTPEEVAQILKVSRRAVQELLRRGELVGVKVGRYWRVSREALEEYLLWKSLPEGRGQTCRSLRSTTQKAESEKR